VTAHNSCDAYPSNYFIFNNSVERISKFKIWCKQNTNTRTHRIITSKMETSDTSQRQTTESTMDNMEPLMSGKCRPREEEAGTKEGAGEPELKLVKLSEEEHSNPSNTSMDAVTDKEPSEVNDVVVETVEREDEEEEEEAENDSNSDVVAAGEKNAATSNASAVADCCAICMETVNLLACHNCPQCVPTAWRICESCDAQLLSRTCPICQHEYKELMLHMIDNLPQMPINFATIADPKDRYVVTMKTRSVFEVFSRTNAAIWNPATCRMYFSLPHDMSVPPAEMKFILVSIPFSPEKIVDGNKFRFISSVWDDIERELENGEEADAEDTRHMVDAAEAARWHMKALKNPGARAFTPLNPDEWEDLVANFVYTYDVASNSNN
jgi:hypothetical protein